MREQRQELTRILLQPLLALFSPIPTQTSKSARSTSSTRYIWSPSIAAVNSTAKENSSRDLPLPSAPLHDYCTASTLTTPITFLSSSVTSSAPVDNFRPPAPYVFNTASLGKPNAIRQLTAELGGYAIDVAIISETHLKRKHTDETFNINGYQLFRRDRPGRRGGGVAVYI